MLVSSLLYTTLSTFVQFVEDHVWLFECSPPSCQAPWNHCEEKRDKFITPRINNKSPFHFGFDTCRHSVEFWKPSKRIFFFLSEWNSLIRGKTSSFERNTILSHLPETLKVLFWLTYPFFLKTMQHFSFHACFAEKRCWLRFRGRNMWLLSFRVQFLQF